MRKRVGATQSSSGSVLLVFTTLESGSVHGYPSRIHIHAYGLAINDDYVASVKAHHLKHGMWPYAVHLRHRLNKRILVDKELPWNPALTPTIPLLLSDAWSCPTVSWSLYSCQENGNATPSTEQLKRDSMDSRMLFRLWLSPCDRISAGDDAIPSEDCFAIGTCFTYVVGTQPIYSSSHQSREHLVPEGAQNPVVLELAVVPQNDITSVHAELVLIGGSEVKQRLLRDSGFDSVHLQLSFHRKHSTNKHNPIMLPTPQPYHRNGSQPPAKQSTRATILLLSLQTDTWSPSLPV